MATTDTTSPRPEVRTGPTYVKTEKSSNAGWLIAGIVIVGAIIAFMTLAPFDRTVTTTGTANKPAVENNVTVQPPATTTTPSTTPSTTDSTTMDSQPATPTDPATQQAPAVGTQTQPQAPAANPKFRAADQIATGDTSPVAISIWVTLDPRVI